MIIKYLTIRNTEDIDKFTVYLSPGINIIEGQYSRTINKVISDVLGYREYENNRNSLIVKEDMHADIGFNDMNGINTDGEFSIKDVIPEIRRCCFFLNDESQLFEKRLLQYKRPDDFYTPSEFIEITGGLGNTSIFREYLCDYIKSFKPKPVDEENGLFLILNRSGEFEIVKSCRNGFRRTVIDESIITIFRFMTFLELVRFWDGFSELKRYDYIKTPLVFSNLFEKIDETKPFKEKVIQDALQTGHQLIIFS